MTIATEYLKRADGDKVLAAELLARDLMRSDTATYHLGYTSENALLAAIAQYPGLGEDERIALMDRLGVEGRWLDTILRAKDPKPEPDFSRAGQFDSFELDQNTEGWEVRGLVEGASGYVVVAVIDTYRDALKVKTFFEAYREALAAV